MVGFGITTTSLPPATEGTPYSTQLQALGGARPTSGRPSELFRRADTFEAGVLSGTVPDAVTPGNSTINVKVTDHISPAQDDGDCVPHPDDPGRELDARARGDDGNGNRRSGSCRSARDENDAMDFEVAQPRRMV